MWVQCFYDCSLLVHKLLELWLRYTWWVFWNMWLVLGLVLSFLISESWTSYQVIMCLVSPFILIRTAFGWNLKVKMKVQIIGLLVYCDGLRDSDWFQGLSWIQKYAGRSNGLHSICILLKKIFSSSWTLVFPPFNLRGSVKNIKWPSLHVLRTISILITRRRLSTLEEQNTWFSWCISRSKWFTSCIDTSKLQCITCAWQWRSSTGWGANCSWMGNETASIYVKWHSLVQVEDTKSWKKIMPRLWKLYLSKCSRVLA